MNQPDRYERFVLADDAKKVTYTRDTKLAHAATFTILQEDHTIGNMIRMQLQNEDKSIVFGGYRIPHPLEAKMVIKVQTNGQKPPHVALDQAIEALKQELAELKDKFEEELRVHSHMMQY